VVSGLDLLATQPALLSRMLKNPPRGVLTSLRGSTYGLGIELASVSSGWAGENRVRLTSLLVVALRDGFLTILWEAEFVAGLRNGFRASRCEEGIVGSMKAAEAVVVYTLPVAAGLAGFPGGRSPSSSPS
jgi:hypothetical protein